MSFDSGRMSLAQVILAIEDALAGNEYRFWSGLPSEIQYVLAMGVVRGTVEVDDVLGQIHAVLGTSRPRDEQVVCEVRWL